MHLKNKIPAFQALERPIEGVHGEILRLPEEPNLEFRIVKASLRERSNAEKAVGFKGPIGLFWYEICDSDDNYKGEFCTAGSAGSLPTNPQEAIDKIRDTYKARLQTPEVFSNS